jgi:undecaprenyl-diphosphatase
MSPRRIGGVAAGAAGLAACWAATLAVRGLTGLPGLEVDAAWARFVREHRSAPATAVSQVLAVLGASPWSVVVTAALAALLWWRRGPRLALLLVVAALVDEGLVTAMKLVDQRPGPSGAVFEDRGSFPSGHTAFAAVVAVVLVLAARRWPAKAAALLLIPVMAVSRTVVDAHWLTDTIAGAVCGASTAVLLDALLPPGRPRRPSP